MAKEKVRLPEARSANIGRESCTKILCIGYLRGHCDRNGGVCEAHRSPFCANAGLGGVFASQRSSDYLLRTTLRERERARPTEAGLHTVSLVPLKESYGSVQGYPQNLTRSTYDIDIYSNALKLA